MADPSIAIQVPLWVEIISKLGVPSIALLGAIYTACQYYRTQRWRAGDLAANLIGQLETDDELAFACRALDWGVGPLVVPKRYKPLLKKTRHDQKIDTFSESGGVINYNGDLMFRALQVRLSFNPKSEPEGLIYRYCFDKLFNHLSNTHRLLERGQLYVSDLGPLVYWLERVAIYEYPPPHIAGDQVFQPFLQYQPFGYQRVIALGRKLGVHGWHNTSGDLRESILAHQHFAN